MVHSSEPLPADHTRWLPLPLKLWISYLLLQVSPHHRRISDLGQHSQPFPAALSNLRIHTQHLRQHLHGPQKWIIGAFINLFGSIAINFGTNLLKLGHNEREMHSMLESDGTNGKLTLKPIIQRVGIIVFLLGNCLNFISFGYAAQSLLAALGSIQFVSNFAFAFFVLNKMVTVKILVATAFIVLGNIFLVAFGNHQSPGEENLCLLFLGKTLDRIGICC